MATKPAEPAQVKPVASASVPKIGINILVLLILFKQQCLMFPILLDAKPAAPVPPAAPVADAAKKEEEVFICML